MSSSLTNRQAVLTILTVIEVLVLLFFVARWYGRRWGWRRSTHRLRSYLWATMVDLGRPALQVYRFSRGVRVVSRQLADPGLSERVSTANVRVAGALADHPDAWPYAVLLSRNAMSVAIAGPVAPPVPDTWRDEGGWWSLPGTAATGSPGVPRADPEEVTTPERSCHVALGVTGDRLLLIDLVKVPGVLTISGDERPVFSVICALAAQLASAMVDTDGVEVMITDGVHRRFSGPSLSDTLRTLEHRVNSGLSHGGLTVLVCGRMDPEQARRTADLSDDLPGLRVVTAGPYAGSRWNLPLSSMARITATDLGLQADAAPLERGVARALRLRDRAPARPGPTDVPMAELTPRTTKVAPARAVPARIGGPVADLIEPGPSTSGPVNAASAPATIRSTTESAAASTQSARR